MSFCWPEDLAYAWGKPAVSAVFKAQCADFVVEEELGFEPTDGGEHWFLRLQKSNLNTFDVVEKLACLTGVRARDIGFSGMKDKLAVTSQWFSVTCPSGSEPDWTALESEQIRLLEVRRNARKLRRGVHKANRFRIVLHDLQGDLADLETRLATIARQGVPNYFGAQRFGIEGRNLVMARRFLSGSLNKVSRSKQSLYFSVARSWIFNQVLSQRVADSSWNQALPGDVLVFADSRSQFKAEAASMATDSRLSKGDVHITGPLWGRGELAADGITREKEKAIALLDGELASGLERAGLAQQRRALRVIPQQLQWHLETTNQDDGFHKQNLHLNFMLPAGAFATSVLRELLVPRGEYSDR